MYVTFYEQTQKTILILRIVYIKAEQKRSIWKTSTILSDFSYELQHIQKERELYTRIVNKIGFNMNN